MGTKLNETADGDPTTRLDKVAVHPKLSVTTIEYVPGAALNKRSCVVAVKPFGPDQAYEYGVVPPETLIGMFPSDVFEQDAFEIGSFVTLIDEFTVIVNVTAVPLQLFAAGVTVIVETNAEEVVFVVVKLKISPVPDAARPVAVLSFVHE